MSPTSAAFFTAFSGSFRATACSAAACTTIRLTRCATTSCISRAIRVRSSLRAHSARSSARSASSCSSRSRLSARSRRLSISRRRAPTYSPSSTGGAVIPNAVVTDRNGTNHSPIPTSPRTAPWCARTKVTMNIPASDIPASAPMIRRGSSDAANVYSPTTLIRKPICAGVTAIDTSTTAIGHLRRSNRTDPASTPNTTPAGTGSPASRANGTPSTAHSSADTTASTTSSAALRHLAHHHGPAGAARCSSPVVVMPPAYGRRVLRFR